MPDSNETVQTDTSNSGSIQLATSGVPPVVPETPVPSQPNPEMQAEVQRLVKEALAAETEIHKRELQSVKDRAMAELDKERRGRQVAETTYQATKQRLGDDPEAQEKIRQAELEATVRSYQQRDGELTLRQQQQEFDNSFIGQMNQFITQMGVDPKDTRIDWGKDAPTYLERQNKILTSVAKINQVQQKALEAGIEKRIRKSLGLEDENSVTTGNSSGNSSDDSFLKAFGNGDVPMTKANLDRVAKIQAKHNGG